MNHWKDIKKTRKEHVCHGCTNKIPTGSACTNSVGVFDGEFYNVYYCKECDDFLNNHTDYFEDGIGRGDIKEAQIEMAR